jgi:hypothetical protein
MGPAATIPLDAPLTFHLSLFTSHFSPRPPCFSLSIRKKVDDQEKPRYLLLKDIGGLSLESSFSSKSQTEP